MQRTEKTHSLQFKTGVIVIIAFVVAALCYYFFNLCFAKLVDSIYLSDEKAEQRQEEFLSSFKKYVAENNVSATDTARVKKWCAEQKYVYISVYNNDSLLYETDGTFAESYEDGEYRNNGGYPTVKFADGEHYVSIVEFTESKYYDAAMWVSLTAAVLVLLYFILHFTGRVIYRIKVLSEELKSVCGNDFTKKITVDGNDEISSLAKNADEMRNSIIARYENEQKAWKANTELMTSLSHDIRTPLTSLLLYSDALAGGTVTKKEDIQKYSGICCEKAHQLKDLTDTMFKYFLVFSQSRDNIKLEEYKASELIMQMLGEHIFCLLQKGYNINTVDMDEEKNIETDAQILGRVFDNVFSNIEKYADKSKKITVSMSCDDERIRISVINYISKENKAESTKIGLKSCEKIMSLVGGKFQYGSQNNLFEALILIPVKKIG